MMLGKPKYNKGDLVEFDIDYEDKTYIVQGKVEIIDRWGTWDNETDVSYDVMADNSFMGPCFFKHITEKSLRKIERIG